MTVFSGGEAIRSVLEQFDGWLSESVRLYLLGGSVMTVQGLRDQTEDIDLAVGVTAEFEHVYRTLTNRGFTVADEPTAPFEGVGESELTQRVRAWASGEARQIDLSSGRQADRSADPELEAELRPEIADE